MRRALFLSVMACLALLVAAGLAGSLAESTPAAASAIVPSPIYSVAELGKPAGDNWLMHMGNLKGHRYSSQILPLPAPVDPCLEGANRVPAE